MHILAALVVLQSWHTKKENHEKYAP